MPVVPALDYVVSVLGIIALKASCRRVILTQRPKVLLTVQSKTFSNPERNNMKLHKIILPIFFILITQSSFAQNAFEEIMGGKKQDKNIKVIRVIAPDHIQLETGEKVKLIGLRSPYIPPNRKEVKRDENGFVIEEDPTPETTIDQVAISFVKDLLLNKLVRLEFDAQKKDDDFSRINNR